MNWKRVFTAITLIPTVIGTVLYANKEMAFVILSLITFLALQEFFKLGENFHAYENWTMFCSFLIINDRYINNNHIPEIFCLFIFGTLFLALFDDNRIFDSIGFSFSSLLSISYPLSYMLLLHKHEPKLLLFSLSVTSASDMSAYIIGKSFGKTPLARYISPNKTWEGAFGGLLGSLIVGCIFDFILNISLFHLLVMALFGNILGQLGDLVESNYKRAANVKDSGTLLPGHGGCLDRIDSHIFCIPFIWYYHLYVL